MKKAWSITEVLYSRYSFFFLFDNITSYQIYIKDAFLIKDINQNIKNKELYLYNK